MNTYPEQTLTHPTSYFLRTNKSPGWSLWAYDSARLWKRGRVSAGPVIKGDYKSSYDWWYDVQRSSQPKGITIQRLDIDWTNPPGFEEHKVEGCLLRDETQSVGQYILSTPPYEFRAPTYLYNKALNKVYSKIRNGIDISEDVFERRQVAKMVDSGERVLAHWNRHLRRWGKTRALSERYLEFTFGIQPILGSMYDGLDAIRQHRNGRKLRFSATAVDRLDPLNQTATVRLQPATGSSSNYGSMRFESKGSPGIIGCKIGINLGRELNRGLEDITSLNPVLWAWNSLPFSFVADYFWQFGSVLESAEHATLIYPYFLDGYETHFLRYRTNIEATECTPWDERCSILGFQSESFAEKKVCRRYPLVNPPVPKAPAFRSDLGARRLLNIASLLTLMLDDSPLYRRRQ